MYFCDEFKMHISAVHVILPRFNPDFIQILSKFYPDFLETHFILILSRFYPNFWKNLDNIKINKVLYPDFILIF